MSMVSPGPRWWLRSSSGRLTGRSGGDVLLVSGFFGSSGAAATAVTVSTEHSIHTRTPAPHFIQVFICLAPLVRPCGGRLLPIAQAVRELPVAVGTGPGSDRLPGDSRSGGVAERSVRAAVPITPGVAAV